MNAFRIYGLRAVVTGGGSGLGLGIAWVFVEAGAEVTIIGRDEEKLRTAQRQLGEKCAYRVFDVTNLKEYSCPSMPERQKHSKRRIVGRVI
jgi:gluconate 5-dehydrogenase